MNDQNETAQLRFLEETAIQLRQNGFNQARQLCHDGWDKALYQLSSAVQGDFYAGDNVTCRCSCAIHKVADKLPKIGIIIGNSSYKV